MYLRMPTGLPPETVDFDEGGKMRARTSSHFYVLRPETLESFFILHQLTRDPVYREWGWEIFRAIEQHCRVGVGFGSHPDVLVSAGGKCFSCKSTYWVDQIDRIQVICLL